MKLKKQKRKKQTNRAKAIAVVKDKRCFEEFNKKRAKMLKDNGLSINVSDLANTNIILLDLDPNQIMERCENTIIHQSMLDEYTFPIFDESYILIMQTKQLVYYKVTSFENGFTMTIRAYEPILTELSNDVSDINEIADFLTNDQLKTLMNTTEDAQTHNISYKQEWWMLDEALWYNNEHKRIIESKRLSKIAQTFANTVFRKKKINSLMIL